MERPSSNTSTTPMEVRKSDMSSPVATIADALIAFILSLLRDPNAAEKFTDDPEGSMAQHGVQGACMADLRAVKPVVVDHPQVAPKPPPPQGVLSSNEEPNEVVREIVRIMNNFTTTVDARSTIVDQSVNQNIWTEGGDVTQLFDQEAIIASGDDAIAAGNDATAIDQDLDLTVGDVTVGNDTYNDSFNDADIDVSVPETEPANPSDTPSVTVATDAAAAESNAAAAEPQAADAPETPAPAQDSPAAEAPQTPASVPEPADYLESDLTASADPYEPEAAAAPVEDATIDVPVDE
jgi:hypothetical protein